jgi:hypothetical protein
LTFGFELKLDLKLLSAIGEEKELRYTYGQMKMKGIRVYSDIFIDKVEIGWIG